MLVFLSSYWTEVKRPSPNHHHASLGTQKPHSKLTKCASLEWGTLGMDSSARTLLLESGGFDFGLEWESGFLPGVESAFERPNIVVAVGLESLRQTGA